MLETAEDWTEDEEEVFGTLVSGPMRGFRRNLSEEGIFYHW